MIQTVDVAMSQLGIQEDTGNNDGIPASRYSRGDKVPWCAAFVMWCNNQSDDQRIAATNKLFYECRSVRNMEERLQQLGWAFDHGTTPQRNDVVLFRTRGESDPGRGRHVGLVVSVQDGVIETIEGNTSNKVALRKYKINDPKISGYARLPANLAPKKTKED